VLGQTVARARQLGLRTLLLPRLRDVDTASDARAVGILPLGMATDSQREVSPWLREPARGSHRARERSPCAGDHRRC
jgi:hypothetical protein